MDEKGRRGQKLSCCFSSLPGEGIEEKVALARSLGLSIDFEYTCSEEFERFAERVRGEGVACPTLLAYQCHGLNPISDPLDRSRFVSHVREVGLAAERTGSANVLTAVFERNLVGEGEEIALGIYRELARMLPHVTLLVEALNPKRTAFLPSVSSMLGFLTRLNNPRIGLVLDTWHASSTGEGFPELFELYAPHTRFVHLKDTDSRLPGQGTLDMDAVLGYLAAGGYQGGFVIEGVPPGSLAAFEKTIVDLKSRIERLFPYAKRPLSP